MPETKAQSQDGRRGIAGRIGQAARGIGQAAGGTAGRGRGAVALCAAIVLASALGACGSRSTPPPRLLQIEAFALIDQHGEAFSSDRLQGHIWVANFIFTHCPDVCPLLTSQMANLHRAMAQVEGLRFVSISVDPERDTPARLLEYARTYRADLSRWSFLTGSVEAIHHTVRRSFRLPLEPTAEASPILHSQRFVLVDRQGVVRGFYEGDGASRDSLVTAIRALRRE